MSLPIVAAEECAARSDGVREHEAFLGHEMRARAQQGLGVVVFRWLVGGKAKAQGRGKGRMRVALVY